jgi:hypothetical protein
MAKWVCPLTEEVIRVLAEQVAADFLTLAGSKKFAPAAAYDKLLLTAHLRINAETDSGDAAVGQPSEDTG